MAFANLTSMNRPQGIVLTTILMAVCNAMGWFIIYTAPRAGGTFMTFTVLFWSATQFSELIGGVKNWARILVQPQPGPSARFESGTAKLYLLGSSFGELDLSGIVLSLI